MMRWSVPANVLLAGEYAITRPGGAGIALAVAPRAHLAVSGDLSRASVETFRRALLDRAQGKITAIPGFEVHAITAPRHKPGGRIIEPVFTEVARFISTAGEPPLPTAPRPDDPREVVVDTSHFFNERTGEKMGLGSSAAATVLLTAAVLHLAGVDPVNNRTALVGVAVQAHRRAQNGRGSGYDVVCSTLGGAIRFIGGEIPRWERLDLPVFLRKEGIRVFRWNTGTPVDSAAAVRAFDRRYPRAGIAASVVVKRNNRAVKALARARSWDAFIAAIERTRTVSEKLGRSIGVTAEIPSRLSAGNASRWTTKTSGAGNEQLLLVLRDRDEKTLPPSFPIDAVEIVPEVDGLRRESGAGVALS